VRVSFYSNTTYISDGFVEDPVLVKKSWRTALTDGHEIGNHTHHHPDGGGFSVSQWTTEMNDNNDWLTRPFVANEPAFSVGSGIGASLGAIEGFRTPYLNYNNNTMTALRNIGFTYDISIEEGWQLSDDGINFNWPYTLDSGSPGGAAVGKPVGNHSGLWELGAAPFVIPPALRDDLGLTKITGLDYNLFVSANLTKAQALAILKYTLDQRLASNRAPLFVGGHTAIYTSDVSLPNTTPQQRREVIEEFVSYALSKSQVRIVTGKNVITWMRNPVALGGSCSPESNSQFCARLGKNCGTVTGTDNCGASRTVQSCGTCTSPQTCGGGGTPNVCGSSGGGGNTIIDASFDTSGNTNGFSYQDDAFGTNQPAYAAGAQVTAFQGLGLRVALGGIDAVAVSNMSGGWRATFNLASAGTATLTFRYNLTQTPNYESNEHSEVRVLRDQTGVGSGGNPYVARVSGNGEGGSNVTTGWQQVTLALGNLAAGSHELVIGGFNNQKTAANESTTVLIDDVLLTATGGGSCTPESNSAFCARLGKNCGTVTGTDNCGASRTVQSCGTCTSPQTCGGGGTPNVCGSSGGGSCNAPPWSASVTYTSGQVATADCQVSIPGTTCFDNIGALYAWRCDVPTFCNLRPGSDQNGWWSAWTALQRCN
jgi:peptidoglycan/xylan/chitin deacetylase (PgdA/CDA1 family)